MTSYGLAGLVLGWLLLRSGRAITRAIAVLVPVYVITVGLSMIGFAAVPDTRGPEGPGWVPG